MGRASYIWTIASRFPAPQPPCRWRDRVQADLPPERQHISAGAPAPGVSLLALASLQEASPGWWAREVGRGLCQGPAGSDFPKRGPGWAGCGLWRETRHLSRRNGKAHSPLITQRPSLSPHFHAALPGAGSPADKIGPGSAYRRHLLSLASCCRSSKFMWKGRSLAEQGYNQDDPERLRKVNGPK